MNNNSFTVLPMSQRFSLEPGETYTGKITIVNPADAADDFAYSISVSPYSVVGEDYSADLATMNNRSELVKWIKVSEPKGSVKPNESKDVEFTITVPEGAAGGGQYAAISVGSDNSAVEGQGVAVNNVFELASVVYGNVAGEVVREGEIIENEVPGFVVSTPITVEALISNEGNVHEDATVVLTVSNAFTGEKILPTEDNSGQYSELIMPETTKSISRDINLPGIGIIKVKQTIYYNNEVSTVERDVFICPIWFMVLVFATILAIVAAVVSIVMKHKKKKANKHDKNASRSKHHIKHNNDDN